MATDSMWRPNQRSCSETMRTNNQHDFPTRRTLWIAIDPASIALDSRAFWSILEVSLWSILHSGAFWSLLEHSGAVGSIREHSQGHSAGDDLSFDSKTPPTIQKNMEEVGRGRRCWSLDYAFQKQGKAGKVRTITPLRPRQNPMASSHDETTIQRCVARAFWSFLGHCGPWWFLGGGRTLAEHDFDRQRDRPLGYEPNTLPIV